jgi:hypothetical protein
VSGQQKTTWFSTSHEQPPRLLALSPSPIVAAPNFLQNLWPGTLDMVFIIQKNENPEEMRRQIDQELQKRGLKVKESKTRLTNMTESFDFLGFNFKLIGKPAVKSKRFPVKDWLKETKRKINRILKMNFSDEIKAGKILRICRGKAQYYKYCDLKKAKRQWWNLNLRILKNLGIELPQIKYNSTGYVKSKGINHHLMEIRSIGSIE